MIVSQLLLILHKKSQFYIFMFEAWNVAKGHKVQYTFARHCMYKSPLQCHACKKFGHVSSVCRWNISVEESEDAQCCNCDGKHFPAFPACPVRVNEVKVAMHRAVKQVSYVEAVKIAGVSREEMVVDVPQSAVNAMQEKEFIAQVINCTNQTNKASLWRQQRDFWISRTLQLICYRDWIKRFPPSQIPEPV